MKPLNQKHRQHGLTLIELMVSITIGIVLMAGIMQIFASSKQSYKMQDTLTYLQESGRFSIDLISKDLRRAGYWGPNGQIMKSATEENILGTTPFIALTSGNYKTCDSTTGLLLEERIFALNDTSSGYGCIPTGGTNGYLRGDVVTARYASPQMVTSTEMTAKPGRLFIRSSIKSGRVFLGGAEAAADNQINNQGPTESRAVIAHSYYIGDTGKKCGGVPIPALYRIILGDDGRPTTQKLFEGVEQLQVRVGWDSDNDRIADKYEDASSIASEGPWTWDGLFPFTNKIVSARVWVLMREQCPDPSYTYAGDPYQMGDTEFTPAGTDLNFRRQLYTATVALRN